MKSIEQLAREAGLGVFKHGTIDGSLDELQRFTALVIAEEHKRLLEGSDTPTHHIMSEGECVGYYSKDQMAAAVLRERNRIEGYYTDLMFAVEEAMRNEPQPYEVEKAYERAAAIRGKQ